MDDVTAAKPDPGDAVAEVMRANVRRRLFGIDVPSPRIGRFVVLERIGQGAMGTVFAAWDPVLDRKIALKVLRSIDERGGVDRLGEARALARLSHPNVVAVHEADAHEGRVWIAMELVPGPTLRAWLGAETRTPDAILTMFVAAGRGLAAAHAVDVAHGDFKPENVLVGPLGPKVADFGMAQIGQRDDGSHGGTLRYMAPERVDGAPPSAAADQFAFAAALYEALFDRPPFAGTTATAWREATRTPPTPPRRAGLRSDAIAALVRGLAESPADRHASMNALLDAIEPPRHAGNRALRVVALVGVAFAAAIAARQARQDDPCAGATREGAALWNDAHADRVREAFAATAAPFAQSVGARVDDRLVAHRDAWIAAYRDTCEATRIRGRQSDSLYDLRMRCLARQADRMRALVERLAAVDTAADVGEALPAIDELPSASRCEADAAEASEYAEPDDRVRDRVALARGHLDDAWAAYHLGRYAEAGAIAASALDDAESIGFAPLLAEARLAYATVQARTDRPRRAEDTLRRARLDAAAAGLDRVAAEASLTLLRTIMFTGAIDRVEDLADFARADALRCGADPHAIDGIVGEARLHAGDAINAKGLLERALASETRPHRRALLQSSLASAHLDLGDTDTALSGYREALAIAVEHYGDDHPAVGFHAQRLGRGLRAAGRLDEAEATLRDALTRREIALGSHDRAVASTLCDLAAVEMDRDRLDDAEAHLRRARSIREAAYGDAHPELAPIDLALGDIANRRGDAAAARTAWTRALDLLRRSAPNHPELSAIQQRLANLDPQSTSQR